ncbi:hypothetical protein WA588_003485 [Blastocystis sp. NMH]
MTPVRRHIGGIPKSLSLQMEEGNYYEALQLYRTLQSRYEAAGKFKESDELVYDGIVNMNKYGQTISAYDLATVYITSLKTRSTSFSPEVADHMIDILKTFPQGEEKEKLLFAFTQWCHTMGNALVGYPPLNVFAAKYYWEKKDYSQSSTFFLVSEDMTEYAQMVLEWAATGYASEIDLFVTRPVLWLVEKKNLRDANAFFAAVKKLKESDADFGKLPLIHFCDFLLQTLTRDAAPLFNLLKEKYAPELKRDPKIESLVTEIGRVYFNIYPQNDMFTNMLRMFSGM